MPGWLGGGKSRNSGGGGGGRGKNRGQRQWSTSDPNQQKVDPKKGKKKGWLGAMEGTMARSKPGDAAAPGSKGQGKGSSQPGTLDWRHEAVLRLVDTKIPPLVKIRTKVPWRASSGKSHVVYPLGHNEFWNKYFGQRAFVLRRGANHRVLLTPTEAAGLIRGSKLGVDSDIMGPQMWNRDGRRPAYLPEQGLPAVAALARGKAVWLQHMERKAARIFRRDPLLPALARLAPGRGVAVSLHWTPPNVRAVWEHEVHYEQIIVQLYGVRKWTVCTRGLPPPENMPRSDIGAPPRRTPENPQDASAPPKPPKRESKCMTAVLRRGDVLHLPSWTYHWAGTGPKVSCHLELGVMPLSGADLVMGLGARNRLLEPGHPAMAMTLPLWRHSKAEDAAEAVIPLCFDLPWADAPSNAGVFCTLPTLRMALQRLSGSNGLPLPHYIPPAGGAHRQAERPWPRPRHKGVFSPVMEAIQPLVQILGLIAVLLLLLCFCSSSNGDNDKNRRQGRSGVQIRNDRNMQRKSRINSQAAGKHKKLD